MTADKVREWREEASENIERIDSVRSRPGLTRGRAHVFALQRPKEERILALCDALLDCMEGDR